MRTSVAFLLALSATTAVAATDPRTVPTQLSQQWQAKTRALFKDIIEIPSVHHRGLVPKVAARIAAELKDGGFPASDIHIMGYDGLPGDHTAALIVRWRAEHPAKKPILLLGHMDVVEAKRSDWIDDPFLLREDGGYFYGRGTSDMKNADVDMAEALIKMRQEGFKPDRDIILFLSGDEETEGKGATLGSTKWRNLTDAEFGLNGDTNCLNYDESFHPLGCKISTAEKTFQTYFLTARNPGGHSSEPRPDNAIYDLSAALLRLQAHRFQPMLNETTRAYFQHRAEEEGNAPLGQEMRALLANPNDGAAADAIEANPIEVGYTRTTCVATMLQAGHADNALPETAVGTVNCRIMPGVDPKTVHAVLQQIAGPKIEVKPDPNFIGEPTPASPLRSDVLNAVTNAIHKIYGSQISVFPEMSRGASDGSFFRAHGIPVYDVHGGWRISPIDEREHGLNERIPVSSLYDGVLYWQLLLEQLTGK
jgi:acetylornithine deacetylase/succinyl-diaminopimelate desuccinylase-like protein